MEKVIETKTCKHCNTSFDITDRDMAFYEKVSPTFWWKKYPIPTPTFCPDCRQQRRMTFRNDRAIYRSTCSGENTPILSLYSPDKQYTVYSQKYWWSDAWDALKYGKEYDFEILFFQQFQSLYTQVPRIAIMNDDGLWTSVNSAYCQDFAFWKNCYFVTSSWYLEDSLYSDCIIHSKDIVDSMMITQSTDLYQATDCRNVHRSTYIQNSSDSSDCHHSFGLTGCMFCFWCIELKNASFCILNKQYTKEEYFLELQKIFNDMDSFFWEKNALFLSTPRRWCNIIWSERSIGDNIFQSSYISASFDIADSKNLKYCYRVNTQSEDCMDVYQTWSPHLVYEALTPDKTHKGACISWCWEGCTDVYYCDTCISCSFCFGCIGLRNKSYCILNKQYTKEEYEQLVPRIIEHMMTTGEWWEFFPSSISPFGYNETVAMEYYPLTRADVILANAGIYKNESNHWVNSHINYEDDKDSTFLHWPIFNWSNYEAPFPKVEKIIPANKVPEDIKDIPDDILNWAIECEITKKPFRIIKQELEFYRKHHLPIPTKHPDQRHKERMSLRNPRKLFERSCDKCWKGIKTTYIPQRLEKVYCEACYNKETY